MSARPKIEYVLFDMGLLIFSDFVYELNSVNLEDEILKPYGKIMTWAIKAGCMGKPERQAAEYLLSHFPGIELTVEDYLRQRNELQDLRWSTVELMPGIKRLVDHLSKHKIPICVATGSRRRNFLMKTGHLGEVFDLFQGNVVCADDEKYKSQGMRGKPEGDVFLVAAREILGRDVGPTSNLGTPSETQLSDRQKGLVFEDALPGLEAGKNAGMNVVWIPDPNLLEATGGLSAPLSGAIADQTLGSLEGFDPVEWGLPSYDT